jgi:hypothetical protein
MSVFFQEDFYRLDNGLEADVIMVDIYYKDPWQSRPSQVNKLKNVGVTIKFYSGPDLAH